ncbi:recombinase RecT, partial [Sphingomonas sp.]|uniref:recombinase RecT n=1 Tax=Sphingomonas sp. TaxID=28214 RepID=UPI0025EF1C0A
QIALALPQHLKPERMIRMALTTVRRTPKLLECDPMTLVACIVQASELGLELSGPLGQAYMIPRKNKGRMEASFQIGYRGYLKLAYNTGLVAFFNSRAVRVGDFFQYELGTEQFVKHRAEASRGAKITHFYGVLRQKDGAADCEIWTLADMEEHRDRYRSDKFLKEKDKSYRGPWDDEFEAMGCKTMIRELSKRAPLSAELMSIAAVDEYTERGFATLATAGDFAPVIGGEAPPAIGLSAQPETLDSIDAEMKRVALHGKAAEEFMGSFIGPGGELTEDGAQEALKELASMQDAGE